MDSVGCMQDGVEYCLLTVTIKTMSTLRRVALEAVTHST